MADESDVFKAIEAGDHKGLRKLIKNKPELAGARDDAGISALLAARYRSDMKAVEILLAAKPQLSLFEASAFGDTKRVEELLATNRSLVEVHSPDGFTPLHLAAFFNQPAVARLLLENDAPVNDVSGNAMTVMPLHSSVAAGNYEVSELLVGNGADVSAAQQGGYTPLHQAAQNGDERIVRLLLENDADVSAKLENGQAPAETASAHKHKDVATLINEWQP